MDCTFKTERGNFNYRVGLIITNGRKILMARNPNEERAFYYSVGIDCEIDRLAAIHENFFTCDEGVFFHEVSCFFTVKPNEKLLQIPNGHTTDGGPGGEYLEWIDLDDSDGLTIYPDFYRTVDFEKDREIRHFISRE